MALSETMIENLAAYATKTHAGLNTAGWATLNRFKGVAQAIGQASAPGPYRVRVDTGALDVLVALRAAPAEVGLRPTELYRLLNITSGGLTARLNKLEALRLIERSMAEHDRRSSTVTLTGKGRALAEQALADEIAAQASIMKGLTEREQWVLDTLLRKLETHLGSMAESA
jgi:DNA-binding MarR family transcriptional regulator